MAETHENHSWFTIEPAPAGSDRTRFASTLFFLLFLIPAVGTILFGAVDQITWALLSLVWAVVVLLWLGDSWKRGGFALNASSLLLPLAGLVVIGLVQLLPIPYIGSMDASATFYFEVRLIVYLTFFAGYLTFIDTEVRLRKAVNFVILFGAGMAFYGILQRLASPEGIYGLRKTPQAIPFGPFVNQHHFAAFMEMTAGLALGLLFGETTTRDRRILLTIAVIIMGAAVGFTGSRGGLLSFGAVLIFVLLARLLSKAGSEEKGSFNKLSIAAAGLGLIMVIFSLVLFLGGNDPLLRSTGAATAGADLTTGRFHFWPVALRIFIGHPILGAGYDTFGVAFTRYDSWPGLFRVEQAHNDYLQTLADAGLAGFACVASFIVLLFRTGLATIASTKGYRGHVAAGALAGCFGILVHSFFDFPLRTPSNAFFFLLLAALATVPVAAEHRRRRRSRGSSTSHPPSVGED